MVHFQLWFLTTAFVGVTITSEGLPSRTASPTGPGQATCSRQSYVESLLFVPGNSEFVTSNVEPFSFSLTPYFSAGVLEQGQLAFDRGQFSKAREIFLRIAGSSLPARFLAAQCAYFLGDFRKAASEFSELALEYIPMADESWLLAGKAWGRVGNGAAAADAYLQIQESSVFFLEAQMGAAESLEKEGHLRAAWDVLQGLLSRTSLLPRIERFSVLRSAISIAQKGKWKDDLRRHQLKLWADYPNTPEARKVEAQLNAKNIPLEARASRSEMWMNLYQYEQARAEARRIQKMEAFPGKYACQAQWVVGKTYRIERKHRQAIEALEKVTKTCHEPELRAKALFVLGDSQAILDKPSGRHTYETLAKEYPEHPLADDAMYLAADLAIDARDEDNALNHLNDIVDRFPEGEFAVTAAFKRFWWFYSQKQWGSAEESMDVYWQMVQSNASALYRAQARYWKARVVQQQGRIEEAQEMFTEVLEKHPGTLYASWALGRLGKDKRRRSANDNSNIELGLQELMRDMRFARAVELVRLQFPKARTAFSAVSLEGKSEDAVAAFVKVVSDLGFEKVYEWMPERSLANILYGPMHTASLSAFLAHRPRRMESLLQSEGARWGVEMALVQSIVHRESGFNPKAQSPVGAIGLMQVMPDTARMLARRISMAAPSVTDLRQSHINARLGTFFLADLIRRFEGRVELAVAAYNAGPGHVQRWWKNNASGEIDEFVENIPFKETRNYVKDVLGDREAYRLLRWKTAVSSARTTRHGG